MANMFRDDILALIDVERVAQDAMWPRDLQENPQRAQYQFYAPHILLLEEKLARLRSLWYSSDKEKLQYEFIKIAAIAIRALEEVK
jgi:hypothetical protein